MAGCMGAPALLLLAFRPAEKYEVEMQNFQLYILFRVVKMIS
jgi:hypothetical protein